MIRDKETLDQACRLFGIAVGYTDIWGDYHECSLTAKQALLTAMGVPCATDMELKESLRAHQARTWHRLLPPVQVIRASAGEVRIGLSMPLSARDRALDWILIQETGERRQGRFSPGDLASLGQGEVDGEVFFRCDFALPGVLPLGYHRLELHGSNQAPGQPVAMTLIVVPDQCYQPPALTAGGRVWGLALQLYALRSPRNWGIGDFTDLRVAVDCAAELKAGLVGVNPLHALFPHNPEQASPYSPSSRLFLNILFLDVERVAEFDACPAARKQVEDPEFQARLRAARARDRVAYDEVASLKLRVLESLYRHFRDHGHAGSEGDRSFQAFKASGGDSLYRHALFEALQEHFHARDSGVGGWPEWPEPYRNPDSPDVAEFAAANLERLDFFVYLQWQAAQQLEAIGRRSLELGLPVGLYQDLAVSVAGGGADVWANQGLYGIGAHVGAPADGLSLQGQDWGLPPFIPERMAQAAYQPFVAMLRANMRHAGALRIDHAMGLMRLFWVPTGFKPADGTYVSYPFEDLLGILVLESQRNRCLIIGEDLGTVPDEVRHALHSVGVLSYRLLYFEKTGSGELKAPAAYPEQALVAVTTHDLCTLAGFWQGADLEHRKRLDQFPSPEARAEQVVARARDRALLLLALEKETLIPEGVTADPVSVPTMTTELAQAVHRYLARTPARLMVIQLEDVFGQLEQANLPGTTTEYPNWRQKLSLDLENWLDDASPLPAFAAVVQSERGVVEPAATPAAARVPDPGKARIPGATYRLQFNGAFTFAQAEALVPYLAQLGVTHCYASPYLKARSGSMHGYDIIDHNVFNPEIGTREAFERFVAALRAHGMGHILDIVPNHMGVMGSDNRWWLDVLENGPAAEHAAYFDIDWEAFKEELRGKVIMPLLGKQYGTVLEDGELRLVFDQHGGSFSVNYYEHCFPVDPKEYPRILRHDIETLQARLGAEDSQVLEYRSLITAFQNLPARSERSADRVEERCRDKEICKRRLAEICRQHPDVAWFLNENVNAINGVVGEPRSFDELHDLLEGQAYRLAYWRVAADDINYRRFFDVDDLAALRMENRQVFEETHRLILELLATGKLDGLRIDHPDGLYDPVQYFENLQAGYWAAVGVPEVGADAPEPLYVVVEKILAGHERLPMGWPVSGTTGYDFANMVNGLFVDAAAEEQLDKIYGDFIGVRLDFEELVYDSKKLIIKYILAGGLSVLANQLSRIAESDRHTRDFTRNRIHSALAEVVACFPVYRTYITAESVSGEDRHFVEWAVAVAKKRSRAADLSIFDFIQDVLLTDLAKGKTDAFRRAVVDFAMGFQQYSAPVMAKGLEDTSFYIYNRLVSLNEVGGEPDRFGVSVAAFHRCNQNRAKHWPHAMLSTSTHDSKRSEDVRARINILSECPESWQNRLYRWSRLNAPKKRQANGEAAPSPNDEYLLYQTLLGVWPSAGGGEDGLGELCERVQGYIKKTAREAKVHTSWINPDPEYEAAVDAFVADLLGAPDENRFLADFLPFQRRIAWFGLLSGLAQCLLKLTSPGVPDIYQGNELWEFNLVDPDNRRPVDYHWRQELLQGLRALEEGAGGDLPDPGAAARDVLGSLEDGRAKLFVTWKALTLRRRLPTLFRDGDYKALNVFGERADQACAFARHYADTTLIVVVPRLLTSVLEEGQCPLGPGVWKDTGIDAESLEPGRYVNVFTGAALEVGSASGALRLPVGEILLDFPVALLLRETDITSLPQVP